MNHLKAIRAQMSFDKASKLKMAAFFNNENPEINYSLINYPDSSE
jgi:hypothetical protein